MANRAENVLTISNTSALRVSGSSILLIAVLTTLMYPLSFLAQQNGPNPRFEAATLKLSPPPKDDLININLGTILNGRVTFSNVTLSDCLKFAYDLVSDDQISGPDWIKSKTVRYDIVAVTAHDAPRDQIRLMLQSLLAERLNVALHHGERRLSVLALVVAKGGPRLGPPNNSGSNTILGAQIVGNHMSMEGLASLLSSSERRIIVDKTELPGDYLVHLEWSRESSTLTAAIDQTGASATSLPLKASLFTALEEQLGLKLESRTEPVDVIIIDHANQTPTSN